MIFGNQNDRGNQIQEWPLSKMTVIENNRRFYTRMTVISRILSKGFFEISKIQKIHDENDR